jgi:hypothetical protein
MSVDAHVASWLTAIAAVFARNEARPAATSATFTLALSLVDGAIA